MSEHTITRLFVEECLNAPVVGSLDEVPFEHQTEGTLVYATNEGDHSGFYVYDGDQFREIVSEEGDQIVLSDIVAMNVRVDEMTASVELSIPVVESAIEEYTTRGSVAYFTGGSGYDQGTHKYEDGEYRRFAPSSESSVIDQDDVSVTDLTTRRGDATIGFTVPIISSFDSVSPGAANAGSMLYCQGNGDADAGLYMHDGSGFEQFVVDGEVRSASGGVFSTTIPAGVLESGETSRVPLYIPDNRDVELHRLGVHDISNNEDDSLVARVRQASDGEILYSTSANRESNSPLVRRRGGETLFIEVHNGTDSSVSASAECTITMTEAMNGSTLEIESRTSDTLQYEVSTNGDMKPLPGFDTQNDSITRGDGGATLTGSMSGSGNFDRVEFTGDLSGWSANLPDTEYTVRVDGTAMNTNDWTPVGSGDDGTDGGTSDPVDSEEHEVLIRFDADAPQVTEYSFTVEGTIEKVTTGTWNANSPDTVTDNGDGTMTLDGTGGNGGGDSYIYTGTPISHNIDTDLITLMVDGKITDPDVWVGDKEPQFSGIRDLPSWFSYDTVVNMGDVGADQTGSQDVSGLIEQHADNNTLLEFPDGVYRVDGLSLSGLNDFGMIAEEGATPALRPGNVSSRNWISITSSRDIAMHGIHYDWSGRAGRTYMSLSGDLSIDNLNVEGRIRRHDGNGMFMRVDMDSGARADITNSKWVGPKPGDGDNAVGFYCGRNHAGETHFTNVHLENFSNNAIYASDPGRSSGSGGTVHVENSTFKNNNVAGVRMGGPGSTCRNSTFIFDGDVPGHGTGINPRGVRIRNGHSVTVEDCDFVYTSNAYETSYGTGAIKFHKDGGSATVRNCRVQLDIDIPAVNAPNPNLGTNRVSIENLNVTGSADGGSAVRIVNRDGSYVERSCIEQTGSNRDGIRFESSSNNTVSDTTINVTGTATVGTDSETNITYSGSCPAPEW